VKVTVLQPDAKIRIKKNMNADFGSVWASFKFAAQPGAAFRSGSAASKFLQDNLAEADKPQMITPLRRGAFSAVLQGINCRGKQNQSVSSLLGFH
jgi:hypothetical protein